MIATIEPIESAPSPEPNLDDRLRELQKTVSASRLSLYLSCRLKYFFRYVVKIRKPTSAALHVGSAVHATLKSWNKARWRGETQTLKEIHEQFTKAWADTEGEPVEWDGEEQIEQATAWRLLDTYIRSQPFSPKPEAVEVPVEADLRKHGLPNLIGILDFGPRGQDRRLQDQRPDAQRRASGAYHGGADFDLLPPVPRKHRKQENGIELHHLVKLKNPKVVVTPLPPMSDNQQSRVFLLMESYVEGLENRDFVPAAGLQCVSCEYFNKCRSWH